MILFAEQNSHLLNEWIGAHFGHEQKIKSVMVLGNGDCIQIEMYELVKKSPGT